MLPVITGDRTQLALQCGPSRTLHNLDGRRGASAPTRRSGAQVAPRFGHGPRYCPTREPSNGGQISVIDPKESSGAPSRQRPRRSPVVFLLNAYMPITTLGVALVFIALSEEPISVGFCVAAFGLAVIGVIGLFTNLRVSNGEVILRRRGTFAWKGVLVSDITYARVDCPWTDWGVPGGLIGVTLVLRSGGSVPVLESGTFDREHAERWRAYLDEQLRN